MSKQALDPSLSIQSVVSSHFSTRPYKKDREVGGGGGSLLPWRTVVQQSVQYKYNKSISLWEIKKCDKIKHTSAPSLKCTSL